MPAEETNQTFTADDLAHVKSDDADVGADKGKAPAETGEGGKAKESAKASEAKSEKSSKTEDKGQEKTSIATGGDTEEEDKTAEAKEAADKGPSKAELWQKMREEIAKHHAAGDEKAYKKEMRRLEHISGPEGLYGMYRELEGKFTSGGLVKVPGKNAKPEDIAEFQKALGWTDKPEEMLKDLKLENGAVLGEADKPVLGTFVEAIHGATSAQDFVNKATNWYYKNQEEQAAQLDEADDSFRRDSEKALKDEMGPAFKRQTNAIASLFATAPGGTDVKNDGALYARLMGGRMADGKIIGNDPDMVRFLVSLVSEINPAATVIEDANATGQSVETEINEIEKIMRSDRRLYNQKYANRYSELLAAREKMKKRAG